MNQDDRPKSAEFDIKKAEELERKYDSGLNTRALSPWLVQFTFLFSLVFAGYHYITAGIGVPVDYWHMGLHMSGVILLVFIGYPAMKLAGTMEMQPQAWWRIGNVPLWDWAFILAGIAGALYIGVTWYEISFEFLGERYKLQEQVLRQGNPAMIDIVFGTILIIVLLEAVRRTLGFVVPIIILLFTVYAVFGQYMPLQILQHPGISWAQYINNMYFPAEGIFGVTLWIVSTVVFHFVLFGVLAQRMGLGQFFVDIAARSSPGATQAAWQKSASSRPPSLVRSPVPRSPTRSRPVRLTIPNMKRMGYPGHSRRRRRGRLECRWPDHAADHGGGCLRDGRVPGGAATRPSSWPRSYRPRCTIIGVLSIVHFQAKRLGLKGMPEERDPASSGAFFQTRLANRRATAVDRPDLCSLLRLLAEHGGVLGHNRSALAVIGLRQSDAPDRHARHPRCLRSRA